MPGQPAAGGAMHLRRSGGFSSIFDFSLFNS